MISQAENIRKKIERLDSIKTIPISIQKTLSMLNEPKTSVDEIGNSISRDQVLTVKVLKLANSAYYGFPGRISTINHAVVLLGFKTIKSVLLGAFVFDMMEDTMKGLWEHSLGCAIVSRSIAQKIMNCDPDEVYSAGLLHDIGKVAIKTVSPETFAECLELVESKESYIVDAEKELAGIAHPEIGGLLARKWLLPQKLIDPICFHHSVESAKYAPVQTAVIHIADSLLIGKGVGYGGNAFVPLIDSKAISLLKLKKEDMEEIIDGMDSELSDIDELALA